MSFKFLNAGLQPPNFLSLLPYNSNQFTIAFRNVL